MTDKTFLKNFERHVKFFLKKKAITKRVILENLKNDECPFCATNAIILGLYGYSRYLGKRGNQIVHRYEAEISFQMNMEHNWSSIRSKMATIVRKVKI